MGKKRVFYTELAYFLGLITLAFGTALMEKTDFGLSVVIAPAYLIHTVTDEVVSVRNSIALADAYAKKGLPFELHIYPDAPHAFGLANKITENGNKKNNNPCIAKWVENAVLWAEQL